MEGFDGHAQLQLTSSKAEDFLVKKTKNMLPAMRFIIFDVGLSQPTAPSFADNQCYTAGTNVDCVSNVKTPRTSTLKRVKSFQSPDSTNKSLKFDSIS